MPRLSLLIFLLILTGCYTRKQGCLDTLASNYDVQADDECVKACCTYPVLKFVLHHQAGDSILRPGDTLVNQLGQHFSVTDIRFYLSDVTLTDRDGNRYTTVDKIKTSDGQSVSDDFVIIRTADQEVEIAPFRSFGQFDSLSFSVGLKPEITSTTWDGLPDNHVLAFKNQLKDGQNKLAVMSLKLTVFTSAVGEDKALNIYLPAGTPAFSLHFATSVATVKGADISIPVFIDYKTLLDDVDLTASESKISSELILNMNSFIFVK